MTTNYKKSLVITMVAIMLLTVSSFAAALDLTDYGLQPLGSYDFGGETVTIISWTSERMENYFNDYLPVEGRIAEAEELFNVKIDFMQSRDIPSLNFNRLMAGESGNDLWHVQNKIGYWELASAGALYPVSELLGDQFYDNLQPSFVAVEEALKYQDQYWGIGPVEWRPIYGFQNDLMVGLYNKTLFEREGLPDPYELYLDGEWDWDALTDIAVRATQDFDGDGVVDQWGIVDIRPWDLAVSNGATLTKVDENGKIIFSADEPAYIQALEQAYQWWTELAVQMPTYGSGDLRDTFINGNAAMYFGAALNGLETVLENMSDEWAIVPFPKGPSADEHYWTVQALNTTVLPLNAKDPEALIALKLFLWQDEDVNSSDFLAANVRDQASAQVLLQAHQEWQGQSSRLFESYLGDFHLYTREISDGTKSASAAMAEIKPVIQANLDDLFQQ